MSQDDLNDIRRRLRVVEQDAAAALVLAGAADRDVGEIRATAAGQEQISDLIKSLIDGQDR